MSNHFLKSSFKITSVIKTPIIGVLSDKRLNFLSQISQKSHLIKFSVMNSSLFQSILYPLPIYYDTKLFSNKKRTQTQLQPNVHIVPMLPQSIPKINMEIPPSRNYIWSVGKLFHFLFKLFHISINSTHYFLSWRWTNFVLCE